LPTQALRQALHQALRQALCQGLVPMLATHTLYVSERYIINQGDYSTAASDPVLGSRVRSSLRRNEWPSMIMYYGRDNGRRRLVI
jgi:hypothetical protein